MAFAFLARFFRKAAMLLGRERFHRELAEEMAFHQEEAQRALEAEGLSEREAHRAALRQFGNAYKLRGESHEAVAFRMESVWQDIRYAARQLWLSPGFTVVITLTLALSIGANSAIFSVIDAVLLKPLPYRRPESLVRIFLSSEAFPRFPLNPWDLHDYRDRARSFVSIAGYTRGDVLLSGSGEPERLYGFGVTSGYFKTLGIVPELGREFDAKAEVPGNGMQVMISDGLWRRRFQADPRIVGRKITLNMQPFTVVGVLPPGTEHPGNRFQPVPYGTKIDAWWPFAFEGNPADRGAHYVEGIGRLKDGVTADQAAAELNPIMQQIGREHGDSNTDWRVLVIPLAQEVVGAQRRMLLVLLGAVGMVLLIACANAANLLLARAATRQREIAVRLALGAPRQRLIRQMLTESLLIALLGGGLGSLLAMGGVRALVAMLPAGFPRAAEIHVHAGVFVFTLLISVLTGVAFGMVPAWQASRTDPREGLHEGGRGATGGSRQARLRNVLVIAEVSLACVLLIGAGLMLRSFLNQLKEDPGFRHEHVLTATLELPRASYKDLSKATSFYNRLFAGLSATAGVEAVGAGTDLPWTGFDGNSGFNVEGRKPVPHHEFHARRHVATVGYFEALGIPLVRGRFFTQSDSVRAPQVILINQALAESVWPGEDAVGKRMAFSNQRNENDWYTVVGIVGDVKDKPTDHAAEPAYWWNFTQTPFAFDNFSLVIRSAGDPQMLGRVLREQIRRIDPNLAVANLRLMDKIAEDGVAGPRFAFFLVGLFAALAIVLAAIGIYGVIAYSVSRRTAEFGLRLALGAQRGGLLGLVLAQAIRLAAVGTALGLVAAFLLGRLVQSLIYNVSAADPATFAAVGLMVLSVAALACSIPAYRATRTNPMAALRAE